jgi:hypothetical protein
MALAAIALSSGVAAAQTATSMAPLLDSLHQDPNGVTLGADDIVRGARTIAVGQHVTGNAASFQGPLEIHGLVDGNAVAIQGDVIVGKGGRVKGDAVSVGGAVRLDGGTVDGEMRSISAPTIGRARPSPLTPAQAIRAAISLSAGWYLVLALIGFGVVLMARTHLDAVADALRAQPVRAFAFGLAGTLAAAPVLTLITVALAITIIGIVVIPFALVGFAAATAGALALGFLAVALLLGYGLAGGRNGDTGLLATLQPMLVGLAIFLVIWVAGAGFPWAGGFGAALRMIAVILTWTALTTGLGAVIMTRAGSRPAPVPAQLPPAPTAEHEWQTPTPVTGVTAARRPTPAPRRRESGR